MNKKITIKNITLYAILSVIIFTLKIIMAPLPNIEPVTLLIMIYAYTFKWNALYPVSIYVILEMLIYGFGLWSIGYCYIWFVLVFLSIIILPKIKNDWAPALIACLFGLLFGALYIPIYTIYGGIEYGLTWWITGISYDIVHGLSNGIMVLILYKPLSEKFKKLYQMY